MPTERKQEMDVETILLEAHREGVERAIELSERTGVPLVVEVNGKIKRIKPKYQYIRVPIQPKRGKSSKEQEFHLSIPIDLYAKVEAQAAQESLDIHSYILEKLRGNGQ